MVSYQQGHRLLRDGDDDGRDDGDTLFNEEIRKLIQASLLCGAFSAAYTLPRLSWESQLSILSTETTLALVAGVAIPVGGLITAGSLARKRRVDKFQMERKATVQSQRLLVPALEIARLGGWMPHPRSLEGGHTTGIFDILRFKEKRSRRRVVGSMLKARKQTLRIDDNKGLVDSLNAAAEAESKVANLERHFQEEKNAVESHVAAEENLRQAAENRGIKAEAGVLDCLGCMLLMEKEHEGVGLVSPQEESLLDRGYKLAKDELALAIYAVGKAKAEADAAERDAERLASEVKRTREQLLTRYVALSGELEEDQIETTRGADGRSGDVRVRLAAAAEVCVAKLEANDDSNAVRKALDACFQAKQKAEMARAALIEVQATCAERLLVAETQGEQARHARPPQKTELTLSERIQRVKRAAIYRGEATAQRIEQECKVDAEEKITARLEQELDTVRAEVKAGRAKAKADITAAERRAQEIPMKAGARGSNFVLDLLEGRCIALENDRDVRERRIRAAESQQERVLRKRQDSSRELNEEVEAQEQRRIEVENRLTKLRPDRESRARAEERRAREEEKRAKAEHDARIQETANKILEEEQSRERARKMAEEAAKRQLEVSLAQPEEIQSTAVETPKRENQEVTSVRRGNEEASVQFETHAQRQHVEDGAQTEDVENKKHTTSSLSMEGITTEQQRSVKTEENDKRTVGAGVERRVHGEADNLLRNKQMPLPLVSHDAERLQFVEEPKHQAAEDEPKNEGAKAKAIAEVQLEGKNDPLAMAQSAEQVDLRQETSRMLVQESKAEPETSCRRMGLATSREDQGTTTPEVGEGDRIEKKATQRVERLEDASRRQEEHANTTAKAKARQQGPIGRKLREEEPTTKSSRHGRLPSWARSANLPPGLSLPATASPAPASNVSSHDLLASKGQGSGGGRGIGVESPVPTLALTTGASAPTQATNNLHTPRLPPGLAEAGVIGEAAGAGEEKSAGLVLEGDASGVRGIVGREAQPSKGQQTQTMVVCEEGWEHVTMGGASGNGAFGGEDVAAEEGAKESGEGESGALKDLLERAGCARHLPRFLREQMDFEAAGYMSEELLIKFGLNEDERRRFHVELGRPEVGSPAPVAGDDCAGQNKKWKLTKSTRGETDRKEREEKEDEPECVICLSEKPNTMFVPCGHMVVCLKCVNLLSKKARQHCFVCRAKVEHIQRTFRS